MGSSNSRQNDAPDAPATTAATTEVVSAMSTTGGPRRAIVSLTDLDSMSTDMNTAVRALEGGSDPKFTPYYAMERLWKRMTPEERSLVEMHHARNFY